jgi:hypothetical protein
MRNGIGPQGLGSPIKMAGAKTPAKQVNEKKGKESGEYVATSLGGFGGPRYIAQGAQKAGKAVGGALSKADASISASTQRSSRKPSAEAGTVQDFMNRGPIGFVRNLKNK